MPSEKGGRADKAGNEYEKDCIIFEFLKIISEKNYSVTIEALGDDEKGTDILVVRKDGTIEHQQCKKRNASMEYWRLSDLKEKYILKNWRIQLERDSNRYVALVSPVQCTFLADLHDRACNTNGRPRDFYTYQIEKSDQKFKRFYENLCEEMGIDWTSEYGLAKSIDFLKRMNAKHISEYALEESIQQGISYYFRTNPTNVYDALLGYIEKGNILGKEITILTLRELFVKKNIEMRLLDGDKRIVPQIDRLNKEYRSYFRPLREGLIERYEFKECIDCIREEQSFIISGNAGAGKSGCTEAVLDYCEKENIPYLAIKLDRRIPQGSCEEWARKLGFSGSISYSIDAVSKNQTGVIILDQLDALRWTQANSSEAIQICIELINQVNYINRDRKHKMIMVLVCREYDLKNDNNIKLLFQSRQDETEEQKEQWKKISIKNFDDALVKEIIGEKYDSLITRTREILRIPGNLYIWQHLSEGENYNDCTTTSNLMDKWYRQICERSSTVGVEERTVIETLDVIVDKLDKTGRLYMPQKSLKAEPRGLNYLVSAEMLYEDGKRIGFVHQSIFDYFISRRMMDQYQEGEPIETIVGEKEKQTPGKRYQIQMFLQNLLEYDSADFLSAGNAMLESDQVRFYVKYVFYEILGEIAEPDKRITEYVLEKCEDEYVWEYFLNHIFMGHRAYITILRDNGILEKWFSDEKKKKRVFFLLNSISPNLEEKDVAFIRKYALKNKEDDNEFSGCFFHEITQDSEELFELRMSFYEKYPEWSQGLYLDMKSIAKKYEKRLIKLIVFWLKQKDIPKENNQYKYEDFLEEQEDAYVVDDGKYILEQLIPYIPRESGWQIEYGDWSGAYHYHNGLERAAVKLIKKANEKVIEEDPEYFWNCYQPYMGKNYYVFNEIILHGFKLLPVSYSEKILNYLISDLENNIFDHTSGQKDQLGCAKEIVKSHANACSGEQISEFASKTVAYVSPQAVDWYKRRIEYNREKGHEPVYWSYWGELQYELLRCLPYEKLEKKYQDLLQVLERRTDEQRGRYTNGSSHAGTVHSPVSGKKIGISQWKQIITNKKITERRHSHWIETEDGFIESSIEMFATAFESAVSVRPEDMMQMALENKKTIRIEYIESLYSGIAISKKINNIPQSLLEELFETFPCNYNRERAVYFCEILESKKDVSWSEQIIEKLNHIAMDGKQLDINIEKEEVKDAKSLRSKAFSSIYGHVSRAIGHLLWENRKVFDKVKDTIDRMAADEDPVVRMASFYALLPCYNIDREWASGRILNVYESDARMAVQYDTRDMLFRLYKGYQSRVLNLALNFWKSEEKEIVHVGGYTMCDLYMNYGEFEDILNHPDQYSEEQCKAIMHMAIVYLKGECHEKSKSLILKYKSIKTEEEYPLGEIFDKERIDLKKDAEFLIEIMKSHIGKRTVYCFTQFLEESAYSLKDYAEVIITLCENVLHADLTPHEKRWGVASDISKLIIALYDETAHTGLARDKQVAEKCLELWDIMFEKQIGQVRNLSRELMER